MFKVRPHHGKQETPARRPAIESLESRTLLSVSGTPALLVTVPGPLPATEIAGSKANAHIKVNIANNGTGVYSGKTTVTLYASPDGTYNSSDSQLGTLSPHLNIRAGLNKNVTINVKTVPQNLDGNYFILADVIATTQTVMGVSSTPIAVTPVHIDLSNTVVSVPSVGRLGGKIDVTLEVTNNGNETARGTLDTLFELSTSQDGSNPFQVANTTSHISIKANASVKLHLHVSVALGSPSGNQFVVAVLDPMDVFNDSDLANNTAVSLLPVSFR